MLLAASADALYATDLLTQVAGSFVVVWSLVRFFLHARAPEEPSELLNDADNWSAFALAFVVAVALLVASLYVGPFDPYPVR